MSNPFNPFAPKPKQTEAEPAQQTQTQEQGHSEAPPVNPLDVSAPETAQSAAPVAEQTPAPVTEQAAAPAAVTAPAVPEQPPVPAPVTEPAPTSPEAPATTQAPADAPQASIQPEDTLNNSALATVGTIPQAPVSDFPVINEKPHLTPENMDMLLDGAVEQNASDILIKHLSPPMMRLNGEWFSYTEDFSDSNLPQSQDMIDLVKDLIGNERYMNFAQKKELDFQYGTPNHRFRVNATFQMGAPSLVFRPIPKNPPTLNDLDLLDAENTIKMLKLLIEQPRGLVMVTGPTGSGKSTTLAAMINHLNQHYRKHIITIEDPVEFMHKSGKSTIEQREVGQDTNSFPNALRSALRQAPDVILVGEMRDPETIATALTAAETGHLVISTVHTNSAPKTINRIIDAMDALRANQVRIQLASSLIGVVTQQLLPRKDGKSRQVALEIMTVTDIIQGMISESVDVSKYYDHMNSNENTGQVLMDKQLAIGVATGRIPEELARDQAMEEKRFNTYLEVQQRERGGGAKFQFSS